MERSVVFFTVPELLVILALILASMIGIILCLRSKYMNEAEHFVNGAAEVTNDALESYIIYCRNEAIKEYGEKMDERAALYKRNPGIRMDYWPFTPEGAVEDYIEFSKTISKFKNPRQMMMYYYRELPKVMYSFVAAEPDSYLYDGGPAFTAAMKRFYLNPQTRKAVEDAIKNKTEPPIY